MKYIRFIIGLILMVMPAALYAQTGVSLELNGSTHGTTETLVAGNSYAITDDGIVGSDHRYSLGHDYHMTITSSMCDDPYRLSLVIDELDIDPHDTLYVYDGPSITSRVLFKINNNRNADMLYRSIFVSPTNTSQTLTIRFRTSNASSGSHRGFIMRVQCDIPCEYVTAVIDSIYYRTENGQVVATSRYGNASEYDTTFHPTTGEILQIDTHYYRGLNLCQGQGVIFVGHGEYTHNTGYYTPSDATSTFLWLLGNGDTISQVGGTQVPYNGYHDIDCYDVELYVTDAHGCRSINYELVRVRLAQNPIKTIFSLPEICQSDSILVDVGYEGDNARLILQQIVFHKTESKINDSKTFIPDGPNCPVQCYSAPVFFSEFPQGRTVQSAADICSICINYEHEFMGDYRLSIVCPTGVEAVLKFGNPTYDVGVPANFPDRNNYGSGNYTGYPYGGNNHHTYDGTGGSAYCDSINNMFGEGLDYCFSRNSDYILVDGRTADLPVFNTSVPSYMGANNYMIPVTNHVFQTIPAPYAQAGTTAAPATFETKKPSDHENKLDYYTPYSDFSELVGCPLNGEWNIRVCDYWPSDNGWVFSWGMDICNISAGAGCEYQVGIDSIEWEPNPAHSNILPDGSYQGLTVNYIDEFGGFVKSIDTAGVFPLLLHVYDEFGCRWDTVTDVTIIREPQPRLGNDTTLCNVQTIVLDARDRFAANQNYTYVWEPSGDTTPTVQTSMNTGGDITYYVEVQNHTTAGLVCHARDTIVVRNSPTPVPNIDAGIYPLEGCEPYTIHLVNNSLHGATYLWDFGDGTTSTQKDVTHTYPAGNYDVKYYVYSDGGCADSLLMPDLVHVFYSPQAAFNWDPVYPTVLNPTILFHNLTQPDVEENNYFWEIQYDRDNPYSFHTMRDVNPTFTWTSADSDVSGSYLIRLIARTDNFSQTGRPFQCADTAETTLLIVNDYLQFPNVVTPNGDGINDRFVIGNLVTGFAYPINSLDIYNRWGARVYHVENISSEDDFWDPSDLPAGTYYYRFVARGYTGNVDHNGTIEVVK